jgi:hypothetical protein
MVGAALVDGDILNYASFPRHDARSLVPFHYFEPMADSVTQRTSAGAARH